MIREMKISGLFLDSTTDNVVVELKDSQNETSLYIWIGLLEAVAISCELEQIPVSRPMTHDLIHNILIHLGVLVEKVELHDLRENTFYAWIYLNVGGKNTKIDARPSDALAIALRMNARIYVNEKLLQHCKHVESGGEQEITDEESKKWTEILENLSPEDFGKYEM